MGSGEGSTMRNVIVFTVHLILVRVIISRRLSWTADVARMEEGRSALRGEEDRKYRGRNRHKIMESQQKIE